MCDFTVGCSQFFTMATHANSSQTKVKIRWWLPGKWHASLAKFVHFFFVIGPYRYVMNPVFKIWCLSLRLKAVKHYMFEYMSPV